MIPAERVPAIYEQFPFLNQPDETVKSAFLTQATIHQLDKGHQISTEGEICKDFPLMLKGRVRVYKTAESGREITLYRLERGDTCVLAGACIMGEMPFPAFSITEQATQVITVPASSVRQWLGNSDAWRKFVFGFMAKRMSHVMAVVEEVAFRRMDTRIAAFLVQRGPSSGNVLRLTHQDVAGELGTSREVVSRILKDFEADECLILGRGTIHLTNIDTLQAKSDLR